MTTPPEPTAPESTAFGLPAARQARPLAWRIGLLLGVAVFAVILAAGFVVNRVVAGNVTVLLTDQQVERLEDAADTIPDRLDRPLRLQAIAARLALRLEGKVEILDGRGRVLASAGVAPAEAAVHEVPVVADGVTVATIHATLPARAADRGFLPLFNTVLLLAGFVSVAAIVLFSSLITRRLTAPLHAVAAAARRIEAGETGVRARGGDDRESIELADAFNAMAARLERSETLRRRAASDIAHDLATPATVLETQIQAMLDGIVPADAAGLEAARASAAALSGLVGDLADLASAEAAPNSARPAPVAVATVAADVALALEGLARERGTRIEVAVSPGVVAWADPGHLARILGNVVGNALAHGPDGQVVRLAGTLAGDPAPWVQLRVTDQGSGIAVADLPHVFERFYRADASRALDPRTGRRRGSGLGLTIARELLAANGGRISVEATGPGGTTFLLELPAAAVS